MTPVEISHLLEAIMILCFGISWPISIRKSLISKTAKGKSLFFECFIWVGYIVGIASKFVIWNYNVSNDIAISWVFYLAWAFYFINLTEITFDIILYFRNAKLDKAREENK